MISVICWGRQRASRVARYARSAGGTESSSGPGNVRFGSKADIAACPGDVRFTPESGHEQSSAECPLRANSGHSETDQRKQKDRLAAVSPKSKQVVVLVTQRVLLLFFDLPPCLSRT
jgi:hypothetical protein